MTISPFGITSSLPSKININDIEDWLITRKRRPCIYSKHY
jgi:hypothetical protein